MSDTVIKVENLSKLYRLGEVGTGTISHDLNRWWHRVRGKEDPYLKIGQANDRTRKGDSEYAWALQDVSFDVKRGEVLGIIGRNGAGKSTLLKILSRVTTPTSGEVKVRGRIASLLEVGTGFNPELTGRDNIYLNGAILGMRKREIDQKFDEIVAFAEVDRYIDTPVKRYSSGMYVRLAFAVAAHLEPEILIVDEVLAVGDSDFQRKCLGKMDSIAKQGRTILFVSHNMAMLQMLCNKGVLLEQGTVSATGEAEEVVGRYLSRVSRLSSLELAARTDRHGSGRARVTNIRICSETGGSTLITGRAARFEFEVSANVSRMTCCFTIYNQGGQGLAHFNSSMTSTEDTFGSSANRTFVCEVKPLLLLHGSYWVNVALLAGSESIDNVESAQAFDVETGLVNGRLHREKWGNCDVCMPHHWINP